MSCFTGELGLEEVGVVAVFKGDNAEDTDVCVKTEGSVETIIA